MMVGTGYCGESASRRSTIPSKTQATWFKRK